MATSAVATLTRDEVELLSRLREVQERLEGRLQEGNRKIVVARARGEPVDNWEELWIALLRQYEAVSDAIFELSPTHR